MITTLFRGALQRNVTTLVTERLRLDDRTLKHMLPTDQIALSANHRNCNTNRSTCLPKDNYCLFADSGGVEDR